MELDFSPCTTFKEGEAQILLNQNFFDQTQVSNRDLSIAALREYLSGLELYKHREARVLQVSSTCHLRALRYACEVDGICQVVALHSNKGAYDAFKRNLKFNSPVACSKVEPILADARLHMLTHPEKYDVIDLDLRDSPSILLDYAVQSVREGCMVMCTATDLDVFSVGNADLCYHRYGSYPVKGKYKHEMALRILLACIEGHANRHNRCIRPFLSIQMDSYIRVIVLITRFVPRKATPFHLSYVYQCVGCDSFQLQPVTCAVPKSGDVVEHECKQCGGEFSMGGPIWSECLHHQIWACYILDHVNSMKDHYPTYNRISDVLTAVSEELDYAPLFFSLHSLCATLKCRAPQAIQFRSAVINAGYSISGTHVDPLGMKSDAPMEVIWDIMRCWVKKHPVKDGRRAVEPGSVILAKEPALEADFARADDASLSKTQAKRLVWYLQNFETHWGTKLKAGLQVTSKHFNLLARNTLKEMVNQTCNHEDCNHDEALYQDSENRDTLNEMLNQTCNHEEAFYLGFETMDSLFKKKKRKDAYSA